MTSTLTPQKTEKPKRLRDQFREWLVFHHYSPRSVDCYIGWVRQFVIWAGKRGRAGGVADQKPAGYLI